MRRVVVTGLGAVTPLGVGVDRIWERLLAGHSGICKIPDNVDLSDIPCKIAGMVPTDPAVEGAYDPMEWFDRKAIRQMSKFTSYAVAASAMAVEDANWMPTDEESLCRTGVMIGSGIGGLPGVSEGTLIVEHKGPRRLSPFFIPANLINLASGYVSIRFGFKGPNHSVVTACATGTHAIGDAARLVGFGDADVMIAGGTESSICRVGFAGFASARALSTSYNDRPQEASRPWDEGRDGFVMGEGAAVVVLESLEHAQKRGAKIYGEVVGYGMSGDAYHVTAPATDGDGAYRAMQAALKNAKIDASQIDYINAHGTSTPLGDMVEVRAIKRLFEGHLKSTPISSTKSSIGHLLGAGGAIEAIFCLKAIKDGVIPATLNLHNPSPGTEGLNLVPLTPQEKSLTYTLSNSFGFGGTNACLIMKAFH